MPKIPARTQIIVSVQILLVGLLAPSYGEDAMDPIDVSLAKYEAFTKAHEGRPTEKEFHAFMTTMLESLDISSLSMDQIHKISFLLKSDKRGERLLRDRLNILSEGTGVSAAEATIMRMMLALRKNEDDLLERVASAVHHPSLPEALRNEKGYELLGILGSAPESILRRHTVAMIELVDHIPNELEPANLAALISYNQMIGNSGKVTSEQQKEKVRIRVIDVLKATRARADADGNTEIVAFIDHKQAFLHGAAGRGQLIGRTAPVIDIEWINSGQAASSLTDFKGKVVILNFWTTWSGLCIKMFPKLRKLQDKYKQKDVVILGITSLQGQHFPSGKAPVDTKENPERERNLMAKFIKKMDITWTIAFSRQDVFNTEYGVENIPHLTILARDGTVRYNGLSANEKISQTMEKIDRLLAEAKDLPSEKSPNVAN